MTAIILDECKNCKDDDIVLTEGAFEKLAPLSTQKIQVQWQFVANP